MKKIIRIIIPSVIFIISITFIAFPVKAEEAPKKGDLRCPPQHKNNGCVEIVENGEVVETKVSAKSGNATITKHVRKTSTPGQLSVWFEVTGQPTTVAGDAYIMVILDASTTMGSKYKNFAVPAAKEFAKSFNPTNNKNIYLGEISFNADIYRKREFLNQDFENFNFKNGNITGSHLYKALNETKKMFEKTVISSGAKKFVVILGDGKWTWKNISKSEGYEYLKNPSNGFTIYSIGYGGASEAQHAQQMIDIAGSRDRYVYAADNKDGYTSAFQAIYNAIRPQIENNKITISIKDYIGEYFNILPSISSKTQSFTSNSLPYETERFTIKINSSASDGWHNTNAGFHFNTDLFQINPEIYWKQEIKEWRACSDSSISSEDIDLSTDYYNIICKEGWDNIEGYHADLTVNNLPISTTKFNIANGAGFPIKITISTNVKCTYEFDANKFNRDYNELNSQLSKASNSKERASIAKSIDNLEKQIFNKYKSRLNELDNYIESFKNQKAILKVTYKDSEFKELNFVDTGDFNVLENNRQNIKDENILGQKIVTNGIYTIRLSKSLQLPLSCLSMKGGEAEDCISNSNTQISGGNNFYTSLGKTGGYVSVYLENATFFGSDIKLEGEKNNANGNNPKCEFINSKDDLKNTTNMVIFRQIELADPFIQTYTSKTRKIGSNWSNNNYNFVKIIKSDIWSNKDNYQYKFDMSKEDVKNIKKNTAEVGTNSYLGRDCHFGSDNNYICDFIKSNNKVY